MKNIFLLSALSLIACATFAQKEKSIIPPVATKTAFDKAFPGASKVKWEAEKVDFEAEFVFKGKEMAAVYDAKGALKETEEEIKAAGLPAAATAYVKKNYPKATMKETTKITMPNGEINYEVEVNKKDLIFDANGKFIREEKVAD